MSGRNRLILQKFLKACILKKVSIRSYTNENQQAAALKYAAELIKSESCSRVLVVTGAGISTPSGIPDFRSAGTGLYDNLDEYGLNQPTDVFDIRYFKHNPKPFFKLAKQLYPGNYSPNLVHYFLKLLSDKKKLLRVYTQNIDSLESLAGVPEDQLVEAHGSFLTATCMKCREKYDGEQIKSDIMKDKVPICSHSWCQGVVKPDVVFFGEDLPQRFFLCHQDLQDANLLLILGTSLEVFPVAGIVYEAPVSLPRVLVNKELVPPFDDTLNGQSTSAVYCGDVVDGVRELLQLLNWHDDLQEVMR